MRRSSLEPTSLGASATGPSATHSRAGARTLRGEWRDMLAELRRHTELLLALTRRELLVRYKHTVIGVGWSIATPLLNMLVFAAIFTRVAPIDTGVPYPVFAYAGLLPWAFFASSLRTASSSLTANASLVTKVSFPREVLPFSMVLVALVDLGIASVVLAGLLWYYEVAITATILLLPLVLLVLVIFTTGLSLLVAMAHLLYRDVRFLLDLVLPLLMLGSSVVFPVSLVGGEAGTLLGSLPLAALIDAHRTVLLRGQGPAIGPFIVASLVAVLTLVVGWTAFHRTERRFAEEI